MHLPQESAICAEVHDYIMNQARLGIYDPTQPRRMRVPVSSFEIELLELDDAVVHAAGPVVLQTEHGEVENFLRVSFPLRSDGQGLHLGADANIRAAYIVEIDASTGACKETAALANC